MGRESVMVGVGVGDRLLGADTVGVSDGVGAVVIVHDVDSEIVGETESVTLTEGVEG